MASVRSARPGACLSSWSRTPRAGRSLRTTARSRFFATRSRRYRRHGVAVVVDPVAAPRGRGRRRAAAAGTGRRRPALHRRHARVLAGRQQAGLCVVPSPRAESVWNSGSCRCRTARNTAPESWSTRGGAYQQFHLAAGQPARAAGRHVAVTPGLASVDGGPRPRSRVAADARARQPVVSVCVCRPATRSSSPTGRQTTISWRSHSTDGHPAVPGRRGTSPIPISPNGQHGVRHRSQRSG